MIPPAPLNGHHSTLSRSDTLGGCPPAVGRPDLAPTVAADASTTTNAIASAGLRWLNTQITPYVDDSMLRDQKSLETMVTIA